MDMQKGVGGLGLVLLSLGLMASPVGAQEQTANHEFTAQSADGKLQLHLACGAAPQLTAWVREQIVPVCTNWHPKICHILGVPPPEHTKLRIKLRIDMEGTPAWAGGGTISLNATWAEKNRDEAVGCIVHELTHIVQAYPGGAPGWLVEGIADYIRWFLFEPESRGALLNRHTIRTARYDASYRVSANFLDWVVATHGQEGALLRRLNGRLQRRRYGDDFWQQATGKPLAELNEEWLKARRAELQGAAVN